MGGILLLCGFEVCGCACADGIFRERNAGIRVWLGLCMGCIMMMWFPAIFAFFVRFTASAQWLGLSLAILSSAAAQVMGRRGKREIAVQEEAFPLWLTAVLVLPLLILSGYMQYTHYLRDVNGALHVGQSTYGDLNMHAAIATGMVNADFPPVYTILYGAKMGYPFLPDTMISSMLLFGTELNTAFVFVDTWMMGLVYVGFILFAWEMTHNKCAVVLAYVFLFLNGGLGFLYVFDGVMRDSSALRDVFEGYYKTPTNLPDWNLRWVNVICDMLIPQRTTLAGWTVLMPALYLLARAIRERSTKLFVCLGAWAGTMPMIHTHSFFGLGLLSIAAMVYEVLSDVFKKREEDADYRKTLTNFLMYGVLAMLLALPQLFKWSFPQTLNGGSMRIWFGWVNRDGNGFRDEYFWFWIKNVGILYLLMLPAAIYAKKRERGFAWGALLIYIVADWVLFQKLEYDNNKLFLVAFIVMLPLVGKFCVFLWDKLKGVPCRGLFAVLFLGVCTISGALSIGRELISDYELFGRANVAAADYVRENTPKDAVVLTGTQHNNPITTLAGRQILCGTDSFLYFHGLDYAQQSYDQRLIWETPAEHWDLVEKYGIDYIYISNYERSEYAIDEAFFEEYCARLFAQDDVVIYGIWNGEQ